MGFSGLSQGDVIEEIEFCRECGITVSWTSEDWIHDYPPSDEHEPVVPGDPYEDDL